MKQSKLVFCVQLVRFIIQSVSNAPTVNASWMVFHSLKILKKEPIASLAIKSKLFFDPEHPNSDITWTRYRPKVIPSTDFYRLHSPKCFKCGKPICPEPGEKEALRIIAMDKSFHKACFVCEVNFVRSKSKSTLTWSCYSVTFDMSSVQYNLYNSF